MSDNAGILDRWYARASQNPKRIVLADAGDQRATDAAERLRAEGLVEPLVIGSDIRTLDDVESPEAQAIAEDLTAKAREAGKPIDLADPLMVATTLVKAGWAHGAVAGASRATADVIRAGLRVMGTAPGVDVVSSSFFFVLPDGATIAYGDCGVMPDPNAEQLASIAVSTAATYEQLAGEAARVAMLSFSTKGSAEHPRVDKVRAATEAARALAPGLAIDGELQFDAAWVPAVGASKAPDSIVAGNANVFIFPDLDSGNIAYKITERLGGAQAFGPLLQGLDGVLHDLSRGCSVEDIVNVAVISALQAADSDG